MDAAGRQEKKKQRNSDTEVPKREEKIKRKKEPQDAPGAGCEDKEHMFSHRGGREMRKTSSSEKKGRPGASRVRLCLFHFWV